MLSVQTAGCAGMERLGVPARTTLNNPPEERSQFSSRQFSRICVDTCELQTVIRSNYHNNKIITSKSSGGGSNFTHHHYHQHQPQSLYRSQNQHLLELVSVDGGSGKSIIGNELISTRNTENLKKIGDNSARSGIPQNVSRKLDNTGASGRDGDISPLSASSRTCRSIDSFDSRSYDHHQHYQYDLQQRQTLRCPHHVPLSDGEWAQDRNLQMRSGYQQSEIIRSYIKPPPNKTVKDVPEQSSYHYHPILSNTTSSGQQQCTTPQNHHYQQQQQQQQQEHVNSHNQSHFASSHPFTPPFLPTIGVSANHHHHHQQQQQQQIPQPKSKPNVITKLFSRKSSPKSPTALSAASASTALPSPGTSLSFASFTIPPANALISCTSGESSLTPVSSVNSMSTPSSASSLSSAQSLSISLASSATTSPCNYGTSLVVPPGNNVLTGSGETNQPMNTIGVPTATTLSTSSFSHTSIRTPTLSVSVPLTFQHNSHKHYQQQQQQQQQRRQEQQRQYQLLSESATPKSAPVETTEIALHELKRSNCMLPPTSSENAKLPKENLNANCLNCHDSAHSQEQEEEDNDGQQQQHTL